MWPAYRSSIPRNLDWSSAGVDGNPGDDGAAGNEAQQATCETVQPAVPHRARRETYFRRLFLPLFRAIPDSILPFVRSSRLVYPSVFLRRRAPWESIQEHPSVYALSKIGSMTRVIAFALTNNIRVIYGGVCTVNGFAQLRVLPLRQFDRVRSSKLPRNGAQSYRPRFTCKSRETVNSRRFSLFLASRPTVSSFSICFTGTMCSVKVL